MFAVEVVAESRVRACCESGSFEKTEYEEEEDSWLAVGGGAPLLVPVVAEDKI